MSEYQEQCALFEWAAWNAPRVPELRLLFAIPNGGHRRKGVAGQLKAAGVRAGVPDIFLPVARQGYHGMWIELKYGRGRTSGAQDAWIETLREQGYDVAVAHGWQPAAQLVCRYLGHDPAALGVEVRDAA
jgi:hypothetical protein